MGKEAVEADSCACRSTGEIIGLRRRFSTRAAARYWAKVDKAGEGGCWVWTGALNSAGYGSFGLLTHPKVVSVSTHRLAWSIANDSEIPDGMVVMHSCDNRRCVCPEHLSLGTVAENNADMTAKGRGRFGANRPSRAHVGASR